MDIHVYLAVLFPIFTVAFAIPENFKYPYFFVLPKNNEGISLEAPPKYLQGNKDVPILRTLDKSIKAQTPHPNLLHTNRMIEIMNFMKDHVQSTLFLYEEMKRISSTHLIKDELREMVSYLERSKNSQLKKKVLDFYNNQRMSMKKVKTKDPWRFKKNDLVINYMKDPFNYGVLT
ncbi:unnamed protein product [Colias eurytheme]|nr:unnamed protein product [Colias eurytheme]